MKHSYTVSILVLVGLLVVGGVGAHSSMAETTAPNATTDKLQIAVTADGDARVTLVSTYALTNESEAAAFRGLQNDTATQEQLKQSYYTRLQQLANDTAAQTGREMQVTAPAITLTTQGDTGIVRLAVTWENLLAQDGDRIVLTEPFESGFAFDRPLVVTAPDGYQIADAQPSPDATDGTAARWSTVDAQDNFSVTLAPTSADTPVDDTTQKSGSGLPLALIGGIVVVLGAAIVLFLRR